MAGPALLGHAPVCSTLADPAARTAWESTPLACRVLRGSIANKSLLTCIEPRLSPFDTKAQRLVELKEA